MQDISRLGAALRCRELTAEALLERCLDRIRRVDPQLNSFVALDEAGAREAAQVSDRRLAAGAPRSPLEGIPLSVKDNILVAGMPARVVRTLTEGDIARKRAGTALYIELARRCREGLVPALALEAPEAGRRRVSWTFGEHLG